MSFKISVCIPAYNVSPNFLRAAVNSVLDQGNGFIKEVVISDDNSNIDYSEVARDYASTVVKYYRNKTNLGMVGNWNASVRRSSGDLVMVLGHDDILLREIFENYVRQFERHSDIVMCSCNRMFVDSKGDIIDIQRNVNDRSNIFLFKKKYILTYNEVVRLCLRNGNAIGEPSFVMFRRKAFDLISGYDPSFGHAADVDFNIRIAKLGKTVYLNQIFIKRRIHSSNLTSSNFYSGIVSRDRIRLFEKYSKNSNFAKNEISFFKAYLVAKSAYDLVRAVLKLKWKLAVYAIRIALRYFDFSFRTYKLYLKELMTGRNMDAM